MFFNKYSCEWLAVLVVGVESAIGAALENSIKGTAVELFYWSSRNREVDFVISLGGALVALEVKSGRRKGVLRGLKPFQKNLI